MCKSIMHDVTLAYSIAQATRAKHPQAGPYEHAAFVPIWYDRRLTLKHLCYPPYDRLLNYHAS